MASRILIHIFCEDSGHRSFVEPLVQRLAREMGIAASTQVISAKGGPARLWENMDAYLATIRARVRPKPDALVVCIDGNCVGHVRRGQEIRDRLGAAWSDALVTAVPHAHVERWYLADEACCDQVIGGLCAPLPEKCSRGLYKDLLRERVRSGGHEPVADGLEFGPDLAEGLDLFRAGKADASLKVFLGALRARLKSITLA